MSNENSTKPRISVVTPVYGCADCLQKLYDRLTNSLTDITDEFEILMVNDASPDDAWRKIKELAGKDKRVKGINFSRNFGQHHAITAGLDYAGGDWVVVMDCDLQDQPEEIHKLYSKALEGYDVVFGRRKLRQDSYLKKLSSTTFYRVLMYFTDKEFDPAIANFSIVSRKVVESFCEMREQNRNYSLGLRWLCFRTAAIDIEHASRGEGHSSYTLRKLLYVAYDIIVSHSNKPLRISIVIGFLMSLTSILYTIFLITKYFVSGIPVAGWTSTMVSIYFVGGVLMANMGVLGLYLGKTFNESKARPLYVVSETTDPDQQ